MNEVLSTADVLDPVEGFWTPEVEASQQLNVGKRAVEQVNPDAAETYHRELSDGTLSVVRLHTPVTTVPVRDSFNYPFMR